jgi:DNA-binding NtrC family response regulator
VSPEATVLVQPGFDDFEGTRSMRRPPTVDLGSDVITVLSVSPIRDDHDILGRVLNRKNWIIQRADSLASGVAKLRQNRAPVVISEQDLLPGTWREVWAEAARLPIPPFFIVTSRLADEYLWAEALNIGAYDVLAKPFDAVEVNHVVSLAWLNWKYQHEIGNCLPKRVMAAAGD